MRGRISKDGDMIQASPGNYVIAYRAINPKGEWEDAVVLSPEKDLAPVLERNGYRNVEVQSARPL